MSLLLTIICTIGPVAQAVPPKTPALANIFGLKLGQATVEEVERKLGKGWSSTGGHPNGRRTWFDPKLRVLIELDGFDYARNGRLIDGINFIAQTDTSKNIPRIALDPKLYGPWGLLFRKPKAAVLSFLQMKQWAYNASPEAILLEQQGKVTYSAGPDYPELTYSTWRATLTFREGKLCSALLSVE